MPAPLLQPLADRVRLNSPVDSVRRDERQVHVTVAGRSPEQFDAVVMAAHADQSLKMLADASAAEREVLGSFPYQENVAIVHTDPSLLPSRRRAWASWNYCIPRDRPARRADLQPEPAPEARGA